MQCMVGRSPVARKSCSVSHLLYWFHSMASNCWLPALSIYICSAWIAAYCREDAWLFCPCEKTVACGFAHASFTLANVAKTKAPGNGHGHFTLVNCSQPTQICCVPTMGKVCGRFAIPCIRLSFILCFRH